MKQSKSICKLVNCLCMNKHGFIILKFSTITPWKKQNWFKVQLKTVLWCDSTTQQVLSVCVFVYFINCICIYIYIYIYIYI